MSLRCKESFYKVEWDTFAHKNWRISISIEKCGFGVKIEKQRYFKNKLKSKRDRNRYKGGQKDLNYYANWRQPQLKIKIQTNNWRLSYGGQTLGLNARLTDSIWPIMLCVLYVFTKFALLSQRQFLQNHFKIKAHWSLWYFICCQSSLNSIMFEILIYAYLVGSHA